MRSSLVNMAIKLIAEKGVEQASVLEITKRLKISNGIFYYYFKNKDHLITVVGETIVRHLIDRIQEEQRDDPAAKIAAGHFMILSYIDADWELKPIVRRVLNEIPDKYPTFSENIRRDLVQGVTTGRFRFEDLDAAHHFSRALLVSALDLKQRRRDGGARRNDGAINRQTVLHTLLMLGVPAEEAAAIVASESEFVGQLPAGALRPEAPAI